jgi:hypothetical protein
MPYTTVNEAQVTNGDEAKDVYDTLMNALDLASDQDQVTFITDERGKRIAAVVPVEFAERALARESL